MEKLYRWLYLKAIKGLGEVSIKKLWLRFGSAEAILRADLKEIQEIIGTERARAFERKELSFDPEKELKKIEKEGLSWVTLEDENYPTPLKEIEDPPPFLFYVGDLKNIPMIGIVGARKPDPQSRGFIKRVVQEIVKKGYGVCSGGALGCDFYSHKECLDMGGYSVCFLGMGILRIPPYLQKLPYKNMLFASELLPDAMPEEYTFPRRNRLISALSKSLVIAEAGETSGSLITASYAIKYKKTIWVYIGNPLSQRWVGCIRLVNEGKAKILYDPKLLFDGLPSPEPFKDPLLELLTTPKTLDELLEITRMSPGELIFKLSTFEIEGVVRKSGPYYMVV